MILEAILFRKFWKPSQVDSTVEGVYSITNNFWSKQAKYLTCRLVKRDYIIGNL